MERLRNATYFELSLSLQEQRTKQKKTNLKVMLHYIPFHLRPKDESLFGGENRICKERKLRNRDCYKQSRHVISIIRVLFALWQQAKGSNGKGGT